VLMLTDCADVKRLCW